MDLFEGLAAQDTILRLAPDSPEAQEIREMRREWAAKTQEMLRDVNEETLRALGVDTSDMEPGKELRVPIVKR